ncbi:permease [Thermosulfurimonas dismutans]|uniref:Transporter n=1 Tax=Thermosulfurimonas dismutans TaxID=999894 RepID=A0A179D499_9BACT|nr:permease [Thermosulfurimonas dismutans]OAQ20803.1 Transporter [Thermosulfurimonas dismutans]
MNWRKELRFILLGTVVFTIFYFWPYLIPGLSGDIAPGEDSRLFIALKEGLLFVHEYAREHVILCLLPAFFIAGAISVFLSKESVMRYLGPKAPRPVAYGMASVAGTILAVCSCTVLPLFAGIYMRGAGLGPATTFLYSGPAINVLAIVFTAGVLGPALGIARGLTAVGTSVIIGLTMAFLFRREEAARAAEMETLEAEKTRPFWQSLLFMATLIAILLFAHDKKWIFLALAAFLLAFELVFLFRVPFTGVLFTGGLVLGAELLFRGHELSFILGIVGLSVFLHRAGGEAREWLTSSYFLARQILPLLFLGVFFAGFFLGRPGTEGLIPSHYVAKLVGGNSLSANLFASVVGALMYFATLTEIPILQGLLGAGMGIGPALALLLSGPAVSLPNLLVIRSVLGMRKTIAYLALVVTVSTLSGFIFGKVF